MPCNASTVSGSGHDGSAASCSWWWRDVEGWTGMEVVEEVEDGLGSLLTNLIDLWCTGGGRGVELGSLAAMAAGLGKST